MSPAYNHSLRRQAAAEDILGGIAFHDVSRMPAEDDLTPKQKEQIRDLSFGQTMSTERKTTLFARYPHIVYYPLFMLSKYIQQVLGGRYTPQADSLWQLWKESQPGNLDKANLALSNPLPDEILRDILQNPGAIRLGIAEAIEILAQPQNQWPDFFIQGLARLYPDEARLLSYRSHRGRLIALRQAVRIPSEINLQMAEGVLGQEFRDGNGWEGPRRLSHMLCQHTLRQQFKITRMLQDVRLQSQSRDSTWKEASGQWEAGGQDILDAIRQVQDALRHGRELPFQPTHPFAYYIDAGSPLGATGMLYFGSMSITPSLLEQIMPLIKEPSASYLLLITGQADAVEYFLQRHRPDSNPSPDKPQAGAHLIETDTGQDHFLMPYGRLCAETLRVGYDGSTYLDKMDRIAYIDQREESDAYLAWYRREKRRHAEHPDYFYDSLLQSPLFRQVTYQAGRTLAGLHIHRHRMLKPDEYKPYAATWTEETPFMLDAARKIWADVPDYMRENLLRQDRSQIDLWFLLTSGVFSCTAVAEHALRNPSDARKVLDGIRCQNMNQSFLDRLRSQIEAAEKKAEEGFRTKLPDFLGSEAVRRFPILDFPELVEMAHAFFRRNLPPQAIRQAQERFQDLIVYVVDAGAARSHFGDDLLRQLRYSPDQARGFFAPRYSGFSEKHDSIVVYRQPYDQDDLRTLMQDLLGMRSQAPGDLSLSEENTLWHEVAHAMTGALPEGSRSGARPETEHQWLQDPDEIAALSYGNLAHIRSRLQSFFEKEFPLPQRITAGLLDHIRNDLIATFADEFHGLTRDEANARIAEVMSEFDQEIQEIASSMSREEQVKILTDIFTEFFMGRLTRSKVEDQIERTMKELGRDPNRGWTVPNPPQVPETYEYRTPGTRDRWVARLEQRPDYPVFLQNAQKTLDQVLRQNQDRLPPAFRPYVHRARPNRIRIPFELEDLLMYLFHAPWTVPDVDLTQTNDLFESAVPMALRQEVQRIVEQEKTMRQHRRAIPSEQGSMVTPEEAEEAGRFMAETAQEYGPDWFWMAAGSDWEKTGSASPINWYQHSLRQQSSRRRQPAWICGVANDGTIDAIELENRQVGERGHPDVPNCGPHSERWYYNTNTGDVEWWGLAQVSTENLQAVENWLSKRRRTVRRHVCLYDIENRGGIRSVKKPVLEERTASAAFNWRRHAGSHPNRLTSDQMLHWLSENRCRNVGGLLDHNEAKEIAGFADEWTLTTIDPKSVTAAAMPPRRSRRRLPVVVGIAPGGQYQILDGLHRCAEANYRGENAIPAYVGRFWEQEPPATKTAGASPQYRFHRDCVNIGRDLPKMDDMIEQSAEIDYEEFVRYVDEKELAEMFPFYGWKDPSVLQMKNDWAVSYHRSRFGNIPCCYLVHSAIEYIFLPDRLEK